MHPFMSISMRRFTRRAAFLCIAVVFLTTARAVAPALADTRSVHVDVPASTGAPVWFEIPGFDPALGMLTRLDACVGVDFERTTELMTVHVNPFLVGVPVSYSARIGMGATLGGYDAVGWVGIASTSDEMTVEGTQPSWDVARPVTVSGHATTCTPITNPNVLVRFMTSGTTPWYMSRDSRFSSDWTSPAAPAAYVIEFGNSSVQHWTAWVDITYHYTPSTVPVATTSWGALKGLFR